MRVWNGMQDIGGYRIVLKDVKDLNKLKNLLELNLSKHRLERIANYVVSPKDDPSYLSKSGKKTHGVGYFWSGFAGKSKQGLEVAGFAAIDPVINTAFHFDAYQTPAKEELDYQQ